MIDKDNNYWSKHKEVFNEMISELDTDIANKIYSNPSCIEAKLFLKKVDAKVKELLEPTV